MSDIARIRVSVTGTPVVGPSVMTFYNAQPGNVGFADAVEDFFSSIVTLFPFNMQFTIPSSGDIIEDSTGELIGSWTDPGTGGVVSTSGAAGWVMGVGARIVWNTNGVYHGRRVRGSTFCVPLWNGAFESGGAITSATITTLQTAADALISDWPDLTVWSNPRGGTDGENNLVVSARAPDAVSWLRSRRT